MDPISSNGQAQTTATVPDQRSAKVEATPTFQTPDKQPLIAPPLPVTGGSQIAAVVHGMMNGEVDPAEKPTPEEDQEPERLLKPYDIGMLPHSEATEDKGETEPQPHEADKGDQGNKGDKASEANASPQPPDKSNADSASEPGASQTEPDPEQNAKATQPAERSPSPQE